eukprot:TRINITY_DN523_c0_g1_i1.p1 TRINITY_DN523_c0_g1~~TRINITY_DN523_c0_g1_i1.p1  ORF type:complete len:193 (-),score=21.07 TRINITY_DN523_c0_g1_i1:46-624(-)
MLALSRASRVSLIGSQARFFRRVPSVNAIAVHSQKEAFFVDVRNPKNFEFMRPVGFVNYPHYDASQMVSSLPRNVPIYLICDTGVLSERVANVLESKGYTDVNVVDGGLFEWCVNMGPISSNPKNDARIEALGEVRTIEEVLELAQKEGHTLPNFLLRKEEAGLPPNRSILFDNKEEQKEAEAQFFAKVKAQ